MIGSGRIRILEEEESRYTSCLYQLIWYIIRLEKGVDAIWIRRKEIDKEHSLKSEFYHCILYIFPVNFKKQLLRLF